MAIETAEDVRTLVIGQNGQLNITDLYKAVRLSYANEGKPDCNLAFAMRVVSDAIDQGVIHGQVIQSGRPANDTTFNATLVGQEGRYATTA